MTSDEWIHLTQTLAEKDLGWLVIVFGLPNLTTFQTTAGCWKFSSLALPQKGTNCTHHLFCQILLNLLNLTKESFIWGPVHLCDWFSSRILNQLESMEQEHDKQEWRSVFVGESHFHLHDIPYSSATQLHSFISHHWNPLPISRTVDLHYGGVNVPGSE